LLRKQRKTLGGYFILPHLVVQTTDELVRFWGSMVQGPGQLFEWTLQWADTLCLCLGVVSNVLLHSVTVWHCATCLLSSQLTALYWNCPYYTCL